MRTVIHLLLAALLGLNPVAHGASSAEPPVQLGVALSLSGPSADASRAFAEGVRLWIEEANRQGGILGRRVELLWRDDRSDPEQTALAYRELARETPLLLGPPERVAGLAVLPVLVRAKAPCVFPAPATDSLWEGGGGFAFGLLTPLSEWAGGFFEIAAREGLETAASVSVDHPYDRNVSGNVAKLAGRFGLRVTFQESVPLDQAARALEAAQKTHPGALLLWGSPRGCVAALRALKAMRWKPRALYVSSSLFEEPLSALAGSAADEAFTALPWAPFAARAYPGGAEFVRDYHVATGRNPGYLAATAYAGCQVLAAAAAKAGTLDRDKLRLALASLDVVTIVGRYGVDPSGRQLRQFPLTVQLRKGREEIVWPEQMRTARPQVAR
ncbi:Aliphatic amidase expression-regulating protein [Fundidesulfovibrio magnetotacticus]|uniref:Aliphatic amidase expression-regulating protein n=1 Tax=Fundidesulfovibrio magnetotacticus TaxID=2730080 RepID=A0A6V8LV14_9BACT|nr:ABC transporter substrate-binding protein [Fundidesulfovibrio magnetotacticus]GFK94800.1 Aliphatic amidase expression-regulating protein [Fundidesulfovibrio magnetotacticus]